MVWKSVYGQIEKINIVRCIERTRPGCIYNTLYNMSAKRKIYLILFYYSYTKRREHRYDTVFFNGSMKVLTI